MGSLCEVSATPIISVLMRTPLDGYMAKACAKGIHQVKRVDPTAPEVICDFSAEVMNGVSDDLMIGKKKDSENVHPGFKNSKGTLEKIVKWFQLYFEDPKGLEKAFPNSMQICVPNATEFQVTVWETLRDKVPFGSTITYGELAALINKPNAARAVGSAMKRNPNGVLVPCHRVIKSTSEIGNYNAVGGSKIKMWLLDHEKKLIEKNDS